MNNKALEILRIIEEKGYEAYLVGGCTRDFLMNIEPKDYDITTNATPTQIKEIFKKTFDTGIKHGTVTVKYKEMFFEITTYRIESDYNDNRRPSDVSFVSDITLDLARRDFTMNAIAMNRKKEIIDPFNGQSDIKNRIIKTVNNPYERFNEDALRILRAVRFASQLGFKIDSTTHDAMKELSKNILNISKERITSELLKTITSKHIEKANYLVSSNIIKILSEKASNIDLSILGTYLDNPMIRLAALSSLSNFDYSILVLSNKEKELLKLILTPPRISRIEIKKSLSKNSINDIKLQFAYWSIYADDYKYLSAISTLQDILVKNEPYQLAHLAIDGIELAKKGLYGKEIGITLNKMLDYVLKHPNQNTKETLIASFLNNKKIN